MRTIRVWLRRASVAQICAKFAVELVRQSCCWRHECLGQLGNIASPKGAVSTDGDKRVAEITGRPDRCRDHSKRGHVLAIVRGESADHEPAGLVASIARTLAVHPIEEI